MNQKRLIVNGNNVSRKKLRFLIGSLFLVFLLQISLSTSDKPELVQPSPQIAPVNPEFFNYLIERERGLKKELITSEGYWLGELPPPIDLQHNKGQVVFPPRVALPSYYDLRTLNKLTPIKNQGACGSCWAFASYGSLESYLLPAEYWDFSEQDLITNHGFDWGPCDGGNHFMSSAYLARWSGPKWEQDIPYIYSLSPEPQNSLVKKHAQEILFLPSRANYLDNDNIKNAVMNYGAVYVSMYWNSSYYNSTYSTYYCNLSNPTGNHAVAIVGWDDNFDKNKFSPTPPDNGAFIVRNSWGSSWGEGGYFYISYYDTSLKPGAVFTAEKVTNYST